MTNPHPYLAVWTARYDYDAVTGSLSAKVEAEGTRTDYEYDLLKRPTAVYRSRNGSLDFCATMTIRWDVPLVDTNSHAKGRISEVAWGIRSTLRRVRAATCMNNMDTRRAG
jgi:hypothetical protein